MQEKITITDTFNTPGSLPKNDKALGLEKKELLKEQIQELEALCQEIDPYKPLDEKTKNILARYHITALEDPFVITNRLIMLLEDSIEELEKLEKEYN